MAMWLLVSASSHATGINPASQVSSIPQPGWHSADPGFSTQVLLGRGSAMWAAGSAESIAVSDDLGQHWEFKHHEETGALLLTLNFVDDHFGYAAGTQGKVLFTQDGGESWTANRISDETILQAAFGDDQHGVIRTLSGLMSTSNGGKNWHPVIPANEPDWLSKFPFIVDMAALDKDHLAVRVAAGLGRDGEYLWSADGGSTWSSNYIGSSVINSLFVSAGSYWSIGHSVLSHQAYRRDKFGFGYSAPMAFHSRNGIIWEHNPLNWDACHWYDCGGCTPQGCFGGRSSLLELDETRDKFEQKSMAKFPAHDGLSSQWARIGDTLCLLVHSGIQCATTQSVNQLDILDDAPSWQDRSLAAIGKMPRSDPQCIRCQLDQVYLSTSGSSGPVDLQFSFVIAPSGDVGEAAVKGGIPEELSLKIEQQIDNWLFEPYFDEGEPTEIQLSYATSVVLLNPAQPANSSESSTSASPIIILHPQ